VNDCALAQAAWPEVSVGSLVIVPIGSVEQHGPHLPLDTDAVIARAVASGAAQELESQSWVAPTLVYGSSGEHQSFPGTCSIGTPVLVDVIVELVRSMRTWADRVVFVNAHGGNVESLSSAITQLREEGHDVAWAACATEDFDLHAGYTETSLMLHIAGDTVRTELAEPGNTAALSEIIETLVREGVRAVSANGILGDPTGASAEKGRSTLESMIADVSALIATGVVGPLGRLERATVPS
jgi:mycofactocin system creatininase family protein